MDNIKVKLANPYLENYGGGGTGSSTKVITFPSKPTKIEAIMPDISFGNECAIYGITCEDGLIYGFSVIFLISQVTEIAAGYTKLIAQQSASGETSAGWSKIVDAVTQEQERNDPRIPLNRYMNSLSRSAVDLNTQFSRGENVSIDYSYQLSWSDMMDKSAIDSPTFFNPNLTTPANDLTTPNAGYEGLSNWGGTSYTAFWDAMLIEGEETIEKVYDTINAEIEASIKSQNEAKNGGQV